MTRIGRPQIQVLTLRGIECEELDRLGSPSEKSLSR